MSISHPFSLTFLLWMRLSAIIFLATFSLSAFSQSFSASTPSATGAYTVTWSGFNPATGRQELSESRNGSWVVVHGGTGSGSYPTAKPPGTYDYRLTHLRIISSGIYGHVFGDPQYSYTSITVGTPAVSSSSSVMPSSSSRSSVAPSSSIAPSSSSRSSVAPSSSIAPSSSSRSSVAPSSSIASSSSSRSSVAPSSSIAPSSSSRSSVAPSSSKAPSSSSRSSTVSSVSFSSSVSSSAFTYSVSEQLISGSYVITWSGARTNVILYEQVNGSWEYRYNATGSGTFNYPVSGKLPGVYSYNLYECFHGGDQGGSIDLCNNNFIDVSVSNGNISSSSLGSSSQNSIAPNSSSSSSKVSSVSFSSSVSSSAFTYSVSEQLISGSYVITWSGARTNVILYEQVSGSWEYRYNATGSGTFNFPVSGKLPGVYSYNLYECFHGGDQGGSIDLCNNNFIDVSVSNGNISSSSLGSSSQNSIAPNSSSSSSKVSSASFSSSVSNASFGSISSSLLGSSSRSSIALSSSSHSSIVSSTSLSSSVNSSSFGNISSSSLGSSASSSSAAPIDLVKTGTDFSQALSNTSPIDPPNDALSEPEFLGALTGLQDVGADGSFNYSLPLSIPVGINGIQPNLRLNYNSNSKNGLVGWGWALNGLSVISRCNANMIRDGYVSGIQASDNYKYCIDGQRLVEVSAGEYRTESESFLRIKKESDYWVVTNNNGTQIRYGFDSDSKLEDDQSQVYAWYLDQTMDVSGNSWSVTYGKSLVEGTQTHRPSSISYTNNSLFTALHNIVFHYEDREDISLKYVAGVRVKNDKRLARIEMKSGSKTVHSYVLAYQQSGQTYHGKPYSDPARTSRLASVKQCFGSSLTDCAAPVEFKWNEQSAEKYKFTVSANPVLNNSGSGTTTLPLGLDSQGNTPTYTHPIPSEVNGDLEKTIRYLTDPLNTSYPPLAVTRTISATYQTLDINNDGIKDIVKEYKTRTGIQVYLGLSGGAISDTPSPTYSVASSETFYPALVQVGNYIPQGTVLQDVDVHELAYATQFVDVNNDGLIDLVRSPYECADTYVYCTVSDAPGASKRVAKDISVAINTGSGFAPFVTWHNNWAGKTAFNISFFDMNSDGTLDFFASASYPDGTQQLIAGYNNGLGANGGAFNVQVMGSQDGRNRVVGDFNGDGTIDFAKMPMKERRVNAPAITNYIDVSLGIGKPTAPFDSNTLGGFLPNVRALSGYSPVTFCGNDSAITLTQIDKCTRTVVDFNSDGLADIVEWGERTAIECTNGAPLLSETSCGAPGRTYRAIDRQAKVYLSLGGGANKLITFADPVIYRDFSIHEAALNLGHGFGGFKDYNNDGNLEDDSRLQNNIHVNRIDAVIESSRRIDVNYSSLASHEIYKVIPYIEPGDELGAVAFPDLVLQPQVLAKRFGVKKIEISNGIGGTNTTEYKYKGAKTHGAGYGDLGFAEVEKLETIAGQTPLKTITKYYQKAEPQYKLAGRVKQQLVFTSNAAGDSLQKLSDVRNQWKVRTYSDDLDTDIDSPHYFAYLYQSSNQSWDLDGTKIADSLTQNHAGTTVSCDELAASPEVIVSSAGSSDDADYSADGVLLYSQNVTCDQSGSSAAVQIKAVENLDITSSGDARGLVQKSKQYAWVGTSAASATKSAFDVRTQGFTYNSLGQLESKTIEPDSTSPSSLKLTTTYLYNGYGSVRSITDTWDDVVNDGLTGNSRVTTITETYDTNGVRKLVVTKPLTISETTEFHAWWGTPTKQTDANGLVTNTFYDAQGRPTTINYADTTSTQISYRECDGCFDYHTGEVWYKQVKTTGSAAVRVYYDGFNREIGSRSWGMDGSAVYSVQTYNSRGNTYQSTAPFYEDDAQKTVTTDYDALGRVSTISYPDGSSETRSYSGLSHTTTNRLSQTQTRHLNAAGWVMQSVDNAATPVDFTYWPFGDLRTTQVNNDASTLVSVFYDVLGRKTTMTDPNTGTTTYTYNALDLIATQTDAKNQRTCFGYDALGRQTKRVDNASSTCTGTAQNWVYDTQTKGKGQLGSMSGINTDGTSYSEQYSYTNYGLPESTTTSFDSSSYTVTQHYDSYNRPLGVTYPTGYVATNSYNSYGHLDQVKDSTGATLWTANDADALGNLEQFTLGNGVVTTQTYDANTSRIDSIRAVSGSLVIQDQHYQFDELGNLKSREDRKNNITQSFCYDELNRLKAARFDGCSEAANDYNYDPLGNLTSKMIDEQAQGQSLSMGYGTNGTNVAGPHAVTTANYWTYQYDAIGNLIRATQPGIPDKTVSYSPFNTPTSITQGSKFSTLVYGPNQDRIKHSDSNGRVTKYVGGIYEEATKDGVTQKIHYVGDFALFISKGENTSATYAHEYLHRDHIGSIVAISKGTIATVADVSWQANGAWGERRYQQWDQAKDDSVIPDSTAKGFTDHEHLDAVGLIHMNGRVYDPELGRFMSADPFVQAPYNSQSYNRYSYVFNNPLSFTDPSGYECYEVKVGSQTAGGRSGSDGNQYDSHNQTISTGGTLCGQDALDYQEDRNNQQERENIFQGWIDSYYAWRMESVYQNYQQNMDPDCSKSLSGACDGPKWSGEDADQLSQLVGVSLGAGAVGKLAVAQPKTVVLEPYKKQYSLSNLIKSINKPVSHDGLSAAARKLDSHAKREGGTFPLPTGTVDQKNAFAEKVAREILNNTGSVYTNLSRGGFEIRAPNGQGLRFNSDASFSGFLDPRR